MEPRSCFLILACVFLTHAAVQTPPTIVKQSTSKEIFFQVARFQDKDAVPFKIPCQAEGNPKPTYKWTKDGQPLTLPAQGNRMYLESTSGSLLIKTLRDTDEGQYQCFATNSLGTASSYTVFLRQSTVQPWRDETEKTLTVAEGQPFSLQCKPPQGYPKPGAEWLLQNDGANVRKIKNPRISQDPDGGLYFSSITKEDGGSSFTYVCLVSSTFLNQIKFGNRVRLTVTPANKPVAQIKVAPTAQYLTPKNVLALRGKKQELYCIYGGAPEPEITWTKNGKALPASDRTRLGNNGRTLVLRQVSQEDRGTYACQAKNSAGTETHSIEVDVKTAPYFTAEPQSVNAVADTKVTINCGVIADPPPTIQWTFNAQPLTKSARVNIQTDKLVIDRVSRNDVGNYGCNATNEYGYAYKDVYINLVGSS